MRKHYKSAIRQVLFACILLKVMLCWKVPLISESDLQSWDIHTWITHKESKHYLTAAFMVALIAVAFVTPTSSSFGRPRGIFLCALFFIYLFQ